jgi:uncharacterized protein (DUF697 family)
MGDKELKAHAIIHTCAITSAIAAGAYSAIPVVGPLGIIVGLDTAFLTPLTIGMVIYIGKLFGHSYSFSTVMAGVGQVVGMVLGLTILRGVLSIIPGVGSIANAAITFSLQETIGWGAFMLLDSGGDIQNLGQYIKSNKDDINEKVKREKKNKEEVERLIKNLPPEKKQRYDLLIKKISDPGLSEKERANAMEESIKLLMEE